MANPLRQTIIEERNMLYLHFLDHARKEGEKSNPDLAIAAMGHIVERNYQDAEGNWIRLFVGAAAEQKSTGLLNELWKRELVMHRVAPAWNDISHTVFFTFLPQCCGGSTVAGKKHKVNRKTAYDGTWGLKSKKKELITSEYLTGQTLKFTEPSGEISMSMIEVTLKTDIVLRKVSLCLVYKGHIDAATFYLMETIAQGVPQVIPMGEDKDMLLSKRNNKFPVKITGTASKRELGESSNQPENNKKQCFFRRFPENLETTNTGSGNVVVHDYAAANISTEDSVPEPENVRELNAMIEEFAREINMVQVQHFPPVGINMLLQPPHLQYPTIVATSPSNGFHDNDAVAQKGVLISTNQYDSSVESQFQQDLQAIGGNTSHTVLGQANLQPVPEPENDPDLNAMFEVIAREIDNPTQDQVQHFPPVGINKDPTTVLANSPSNGFPDNDAVPQKPPFPQDMRADFEFATYEFPDDDYSLMQNQKDQSIWIRDGAGSGNNDKFEDLNDNDLEHFS